MTLRLCNFSLLPTFKAATCLIQLYMSNNYTNCPLTSTDMDISTGYKTSNSTIIHLHKATLTSIKTNHTSSTRQYQRGDIEFYNKEPKEITWKYRKIFVTPSFQDSINITFPQRPIQFVQNYTHKKINPNYYKNQLKKSANLLKNVNSVTAKRNTFAAVATIISVICLAIAATIAFSCCIIWKYLNIPIKNLPLKLDTIEDHNKQLAGLQKVKSKLETDLEYIKGELSLHQSIIDELQ